eukprot:755949-Rhodomonas_salina.1
MRGNDTACDATCHATEVRDTDLDNVLTLLVASKSQAPPQVPAVEPSSSLCAAFAMSGTHIAYVASVWEVMPSTDVADGTMCLLRAYAIPRIVTNRMVLRQRPVQQQQRTVPIGNAHTTP